MFALVALVPRFNLGTLSRKLCFLARGETPTTHSGAISAPKIGACGGVVTRPRIL
jgi:hypothetical protein